MSDGRVIVEIELDDSKYRKALSATEKKAEESGRSIEKDLSKEIKITISDDLGKGLKQINKKVNETSSNLGSVAVQLNNTIDLFAKFGAIGVVAVPIITNLKEITSLLSGIGRVFFKSGGVFGLTSALVGVSAAFFALSKQLEQIEGSFAKVSAATLKLAAILTGGLGAALGFAIIKVSELAQKVGTNLVAFFDQSAKNFNKAERSLLVFTKTVENFNKVTGDAVGTSESWNKLINKTSDNLNITRESLRKSAQEIVAVASQFGLAEDQLKDLLKISAEYAKINKKDVFDSTLAIVKGLQGNSQALQAYGIKLNRASVQQFALKKGITENIDKLSEYQQVQLRFNKLLSQYANVQGIAQVAAASLADQQEKLEQNTKRLQTALGQGARIIEQNNVVAFGLNTILNNISESTLRLAGFFGALGARVLQIGGFLAGLTFKVFALVKAIKILNLVLSSDVGVKTFAKNIPIINKSLNELISNTAKTSVQVNSLKALLDGLRLSLFNSFNVLSKVIFGVEGKSLTVLKAISGGLKNLVRFFGVASKAFVAFLVPLAPLIAKLLIVVGVFKVLAEAVKTIERRTGVFTKTYKILAETLQQSTAFFSPILKIFNEFKDVLFELASKAFGFFVQKLTQGLSLIASIVKKNPFGVFSSKTVDAFASIEQRLNGFSTQIASVGFDLRRLPQEAGRAIAGTREEFSKPILTEDQLKELKDKVSQIKNLFKPDLVKLQEEQTQRLDLIKQALDNEVITRQEYENLKTQIQKDGTEKRFNLLNADLIRLNKAVKDQLQNGAVRLISASFQEIGRALVGASNGFKGFIGVVLGILGDLAISVGTTVIGASKAIQALKASLLGTGASAIVLGGALIAIGAALKVASSKFGGTADAGIQTGGGGTSVGGGIAATPVSGFAQEQEERREPQTAVTVNVQGDVLDSDESGLRIVNLIQDAFDKNDVKVTGGAFA